MPERPDHAAPGALSVAGEAVLGRLATAVRRALPRPAVRDICPDGALRELLKAKDLYDPDN
eukprot:8426816-Lingulodinium_polyedra.AAC.1